MEFVTFFICLDCTYRSGDVFFHSLDSFHQSKRSEVLFRERERERERESSRNLHIAIPVRT